MTCEDGHEGPWWHVANVQTGQELPVAERMKKECGAKVYCPKYTATVRPARKRKPIDVERAALPSYLMVEQNSIDDPEAIYRDSRFRYFVQFGEYLATVCQCMIDEMQSRELLGAFQPRFHAGPSFAIGEIVKVPDGPYKSYRGQVVAMHRGNYRLDNLDFTRAVWFSGLLLLKQSV